MPVPITAGFGRPSAFGVRTPVRRKVVSVGRLNLGRVNLPLLTVVELSTIIPPFDANSAGTDKKEPPPEGSGSAQTVLVMASSGGPGFDVIRYVPAFHAAKLGPGRGRVEQRAAVIAISGWQCRCQAFLATVQVVRVTLPIDLVAVIAVPLRSLGLPDVRTRLRAIFAGMLIVTRAEESPAYGALSLLDAIDLLGTTDGTKACLFRRRLEWFPAMIALALSKLFLLSKIEGPHSDLRAPVPVGFFAANFGRKPA